MGSSLTQSFTDDDRSEENNGMQEWSQRDREARLARRLRRKKARDWDVGSVCRLRPELVASPSPAGSGNNKTTLLSYDRLDNDRTLEEETTAHMFPPAGAKEASSAPSKYSIL